MKQALLLQAQYNKFANANMFAVLQKAPKESLYKDCGLYYGSIMQTAEHSLCGAIAIVLGHFSTFSTKKLEGLDEIRACLDAQGRLQKTTFEDINAFMRLQSQVDDKTIELIQSIDDFEPIETLAFPGIEFKKSRGFLILHYLIMRCIIVGKLQVRLIFSKSKMILAECLECNHKKLCRLGL